MAGRSGDRPAVRVGRWYWTRSDLKWAGLAMATGAALAVVISIVLVEVLGR